MHFEHVSNRMVMVGDGICEYVFSCVSKNHKISYIFCVVFLVRFDTNTCILNRILWEKYE